VIPSVSLPKVKRAKGARRIPYSVSMPRPATMHTRSAPDEFAELLRRLPLVKTPAEHKAWRMEWRGLVDELRTHQMQYRGDAETVTSTGTDPTTWPEGSTGGKLQWTQNEDGTWSATGPFGHAAAIVSASGGSHHWHLVDPKGAEMAHGACPWLGTAKWSVATRMPGVVAGNRPQSSRVKVHPAGSRAADDVEPAGDDDEADDPSDDGIEWSYADGVSTGRGPKGHKVTVQRGGSKGHRWSVKDGRRVVATGESAGHQTAKRDAADHTPGALAVAAKAGRL
jgi:hypothetical protein